MGKRIHTWSGFGAGLLVVALCATASAEAVVKGWLNWRGPQQNGTSLETHLPDKLALAGDNHLWTYDLAGRSTPVIAGERVYAWGYRGEGPDLQEILACVDAETGKKIWELGFNDFLSDNVYTRYSIGSPTVDGETGDIFIITTPGIAACISPEGRIVWQHSMMEEYGRLTFPNGRTGSPVIDDDLVIYRGITANWGNQGPAQDRFYAFEKKSGKLVWSCSPGVAPKDSSFSTPLLSWESGRRVFYVGTGCGNVVCINARSGDPMWRFQLSRGGINASLVLHQDKLIAVHSDENMDSSDMGRMVAVRVGTPLKKGEAGPAVAGPSAEVWRNDLTALSSSPVLVGNRVYQTVHTGELCSVDVETGRVLWKQKLAADQLHASPLYADGRLYVPMQDGSFHVVEVSDSGPKVLSRVKLEGNCLGAPAVWNGKLYVQTTARLYCFGTKGPGKGLPPDPAAEKRPVPAESTRLLIVPSEVLMRPGDVAAFQVWSMDDLGYVDHELKGASWQSYVPPTAKVQAKMDAAFNDRGELVAAPNARQSAGAFEATLSNLKGHIRGRILPKLPIQEDFESYEIDTPHEVEQDVKFAYPPLPWIGARFKWEVRDLDGNKVLAKTLDKILFQRSMTFIGHPDEKNYTVEAEVMSDGNRRLMSQVGVINQRYIISLVGTWQQLEVQSNYERVRASVPFKWEPKVWYRLKTRVDVSPDGSGVVRAKAWKRGDTEPAAWTIEVPHKHAHAQGAPGLFGFSPQSKFRVYIDNVRVTPN